MIEEEWKVPRVSTVLVWGWRWLFFHHSLTFALLPSTAGGKSHHPPPEWKLPACVKHTSCRSFFLFFLVSPTAVSSHALFPAFIIFPAALCRVWFAVWGWLAAIFLLFCTISSVPSFHLSICGRHLRCLAAVTEAHILIATRWGELAALTQPCTAGLGAHIRSGQMGLRSHRDGVERCCIQMAFACWQSCHWAAVCFSAWFCVHVCVCVLGPQLLFPGVTWHIFH